MIEPVEFPHARSRVGLVIAELLLLLVRIGRLETRRACLSVLRITDLQEVFPFFQVGQGRIRLIRHFSCWHTF